MKRFFLLIPVLFFSFIINAQPPAGPADKGMNFGVAINENRTINSDQLPALVNANEEKEVKVKGKVVEVCKAEGCWLRMQTAAGGTFMIRMKDHSFFVPVSLQGKTIVAQGTATVNETSVDMLRHYGEDAGKSKEEIAAIKQPKKEIVLYAKGILVL